MNIYYWNHQSILIFAFNVFLFLNSYLKILTPLALSFCFPVVVIDVPVSKIPSTFFKWVSPTSVTNLQPIKSIILTFAKCTSPASVTPVYLKVITCTFAICTKSESVSLLQPNNVISLTFFKWDKPSPVMFRQFKLITFTFAKCINPSSVTPWQWPPDSDPIQTPPHSLSAPVHHR